MLDNILILDNDLVKTVEWNGSSTSYDNKLKKLGPKDQSFIVINPFAKDSKPFYFISDIPKSKKCIVWSYQGEWIAKFFPQGWNVSKKYLTLEIQLPKLKWEKNPALGKHIKFTHSVYKKFDPDPWQAKNTCTWYLDSNYHVFKDKIWAFRLRPLEQEPIGIIDMGFVLPDLSERFDIVFISYKESNAEDNWQRLLSKAPYAKRIHGITGIFEAHRMAASISETEMFYVVDGDAYLVDDWEFNHKPGIFDRGYTYIWKSKNPFNDLNYGYGGVKLLSKDNILRKKTWSTLDFTLSVSQNLVVMKQISCITKFNTDPFSTWRSAFREGIKLAKKNNKQFLDKWVTNKNEPFYKFALDGVTTAILYYESKKHNNKELLKINDRNWLENKFKELYA